MCSGPVAVHVVEGDHESFILGDAAVQVASFIDSSALGSLTNGGLSNGPRTNGDSHA